MRLEYHRWSSLRFAESYDTRALDRELTYNGTRMDFNLRNILALVGSLDDAPGDHTARERFIVFLKENVTEVGQVRDYIEECLRTSGDQYSRALQDLVNHLGRFLGFDVVFGRYQGCKARSALTATGSLQQADIS
jgi:hypothetical protein